MELNQIRKQHDDAGDAVCPITLQEVKTDSSLVQYEEVDVVPACAFLTLTAILRHTFHVVGSKSFRPDIQKPRQMENAARDI